MHVQVAEPEIRYDSIRLEEQLFKQPVKWLVRNVELFLPLGTFVAKVIFDIQVRGFIPRHCKMVFNAREAAQCDNCSCRIAIVAAVLVMITWFYGIQLC